MTASNREPVSADTLNGVMEFDRVIRVHSDGTVSYPENIWAPELHALSDADGNHTAQTDPELKRQARAHGWELETGRTGQYGYNGPCMHQSEFIGGRLAEDILSTPGYWVAVAIYEEDGETESWAIAFREAPPEHVNYPHTPGTLFDCPACESECTCGGKGDCVACQRCRVCGADLSGLEIAHNGECPSHADDRLTESLIDVMLANPLVREVTL